MPPITPTVRNLLIVNVLLYFASGNLFPVDLFALHDPRSEYFRPHQFITHMFMHGDTMHLFSNMFSLFIFGPMLEHHWGGKRFLIFYFVTGLGASLLYMGIRYYEVSQVMDAATAFLQNPDPIDFKRLLEAANLNTQRYEQVLVDFYRNPENPQLIAETKEFVQLVSERVVNGSMLGASGAVFGILMAFGMLFPNTKLFLLFFPFPIKAKYFVFLYGAFELYAGVQRNPGDNVAHFAHIGGMIFAYILLKIWERQRNNFY
ncbi:rhomboid family intramembrane serine protease [Rufibacter roseus]|uniref:Rhomboid family intramembrane serine protease n=1 Tax=Rufibacter roseus TaxID=1567108 RepID=A0ABW2DMG0_9BACT|nr:rhomboid family intramembrane serine protease [Rufibacter roseus]